MERISFICSLGAALIGMIFVFLIGCVPHVSVGSAGGGLVTNEVGIFYFFGDAYDAIVSDGSTASMAGTIGAVLGTVCSLVALLATAGCFIATVSRLVKISQKQTEKGIMGPAAATFFAYVCGAALFLLCMANKVDIMGVTTSMAANGTTIAGFVLGGLLLVAAAVLKTLGERAWRKFVRVYTQRRMRGALCRAFDRRPAVYLQLRRVGRRGFGGQCHHLRHIFFLLQPLRVCRFGGQSRGGG